MYGSKAAQRVLAFISTLFVFIGGYPFVSAGAAETAFLAASADKTSGGIHLLTLTADNRITQKKFHPLVSCTYLTASHDGGLLYALCKENKKDTVAVFALPELKKLGSWPTGGRTSCHLSLAPSGKHLYTANYSSSSITEMELNPNGLPTGKQRTIKLYGKGKHPTRQKRPHPHWVGFSENSSSFLAVADLGTDSIDLFPYSSDSGIITAGKTLKTRTVPGAGPRHLLFSPDGDFLAAANELDNTAVLYRRQQGELTLLDSISSRHPDSITGVSFAGAIRKVPSSDGSFAFAVTNRGDDTVAFFSATADGKLKRDAVVPSGGGYPSDILSVTPDHLLTANLKSDSIRLLVFDRNTGSWKLTESTFAIPKPSCLVPLAVK